MRIMLKFSDKTSRRKFQSTVLPLILQVNTQLSFFFQSSKFVVLGIVLFYPSLLTLSRTLLLILINDVIFFLKKFYI